MAAQAAFPQNWQIAQDYDPNEHMMQLKGRDYLNVQNRLIWFIRDQRALIVAGLAKMPYIVQTDLVELDRSTSWAHFKTYVRDVLGNEATMYGSESAKDFADYAEKASTKSLGRALLALGYGTAAAPEMDEGERVVDSPVERTPQQPQQQPRTMPAADETRKVVTPQMTKDRARIDAEPTAAPPANVTPLRQPTTPTPTKINPAALKARANQLGRAKTSKEWGDLFTEYKNNLQGLSDYLDAYEASQRPAVPDEHTEFEYALEGLPVSGMH